MQNLSIQNQAIKFSEMIEYLYPISVELYHRLLEKEPALEKTELFQGVILKKMTKSAEHNFYTNLLSELLREIKPKGTFIQSEKTIQFGHSELEPDIFIIEGKLLDFFNKHPKKAILIVEVSKTSIAYDRQKIPIYAEAGVENYWIVDVNTQQVEVYSEPSVCSYNVVKNYTFTDNIPIFDSSVCLSQQNT
jgi:Uma2 family endonuclease